MLSNTNRRSHTKKSLNNDTVIVYLPTEGKQHHLSMPTGDLESRQWSRNPDTNHESESEVAQSCLTLYDPMDCSLPGSSVHGIFQARVLEWVAIAFSRGSSRPRDWTQVSCMQADALLSELPGKPDHEVSAWSGLTFFSAASALGASLSLSLFFFFFIF